MHGRTPPQKHAEPVSADWCAAALFVFPLLLIKQVTKSTVPHSNGELLQVPSVSLFRSLAQ